MEAVEASAIRYRKISVWKRAEETEDSWIFFDYGFVERSITVIVFNVDVNVFLAEQQSDRFVVSHDSRDMKNGAALQVDRVDVGAARKEEFDGLMLTAESRVVKGRVAVVIADVDVGVVREVEQERNNRNC